MNTASTFASLALCAAMSPSALATPGDQTHKLFADDAGEEQRFGLVVALGDDAAVIGGRFNSDDPSAAYVYDLATGAFRFQLQADDVALLSVFGRAIAASGTTAIVGAYGDGELGGNAGAAYLFDTTTGAQLAKLAGDDTDNSDWLGYAVAIEGTVAAAGAPQVASGTGSAYVFDTGTLLQVAELTPADAGTNDNFGWSVACSSTIVAVGAPGHDNAQGINAGAVYVFDAATGAQLARILSPALIPEGLFGFVIALDGSTLIVGTDYPGTTPGAAFLYDLSNPAAPVYIDTLAPDPGPGSPSFGTAVAINATAALVGDARDSELADRAGAAFLFDRATGAQITKVFAADGEANERFGCAVALNDDTALVGAYAESTFGAVAGAAYTFDASVTPAPCTFADIDANGTLNVDDIDLFVAGFLAGDQAVSDCDGNGVCNVDDIDCFVASFLGGCP